MPLTFFDVLPPPNFVRLRSAIQFTPSSWYSASLTFGNNPFMVSLDIHASSPSSPPLVAFPPPSPPAARHNAPSSSPRINPFTFSPLFEFSLPSLSPPPPPPYHPFTILIILALNAFASARTWAAVCSSSSTAS